MEDRTTTGEVPLPPGYPAEWDADVVLADGGTVRIRPIRPDDAQRIVEFHALQSPESIYFRYFSPHPRLTEREVEHLTHVDYVDRMAFVVLRDDVVVGVARYDRYPLRSTAEVAFFVDDRHRGRGIASILLEYLVEAARRAGISAFAATVLPTNQRMVSVFRRAGFELRSSFEDGVIEVYFELQPTPEAEAAVAARAQRAEKEAVRRLLAPRSVAVVGAGRDRTSVGHAVLRNLLAHEFAGPVYPVNPRADHVAGVRAHATIEDIEGPVDLAVVVVPAAQVPDVIGDCGRKGVHAVIVISAGFAESGPEGAGLSVAALRVARRFGIRLLGPNCLGVINTDPEVRLHATFATPQARPGPVALLSESGTIGGALLDHVREAGLGASSFAAIGNRADVSANDLLQYWADDDRTRLVLLYLESFGNARKFVRIARALSRTKPIVAVRSGGAARAYPADGGDVPADTLEALFAQTGIVRVDTLAQQLHVARVLACQPLPAGGRVALLGNGGGSLALAADACVDAGLTLATLGAGVREVVGEGPGSGPRLRASAVDLGFEAGPDDMERALGALLADEGVDSVLVVCAPAPRQSTTALVAAIAATRARAPGKTLLACVFGDHPTVISPDGAADVPVFDFPDDAAYALGRVTRYAAWRAAPEGTVVVPDGATPGAARARVVDLVAAGRDGWLPTGEAIEVAAAAGLPVVASRVAGDAAQAVQAAAELGYPVAVKAVGRSRLAKTEVAGLALDVHDETELRVTIARMGGALGDAAWPVVVQPMAAPGFDVAVGVADNPVVGPVITLGPGGVSTDVATARAHVLPLTDGEAARFVDGLPVAGMVAPAARARLVDLLLRVSALVEAAPEVVGLELNPTIVSAAAADVVDVRVRVAPVEREPLPPVRRLSLPA
ncbi:MAG TPA: GNAT family N-acetyltransferase [Acidimicrobiales bacterium]|nr:GNAT family N-acetyltransferase [Acidimicrobiales bacterium]